MTTEHKPQKEINGLTFLPIPKFSDADCAFGADANCFFDRRNLPFVPAEYENMVSNLFFKGGYPPEFNDKIDHEAAVRAIHAWLSSYAPSHESKISTVAYAFWLWTSETLGD